MEQVKLPIKTKIAVCCIFSMGLMLFISSFMFMFEANSPGEKLGGLMATIGFFLGFLIITPAYFIIYKKKLGWWLGIVILPLFSIGMFYGFFSSFFYIFFYTLFYSFLHEIYNEISILIPLILIVISFYFLLSDRKNFWKIAS